jgi:hypothetical protein
MMTNEASTVSQKKQKVNNHPVSSTTSRLSNRLQTKSLELGDKVKDGHEEKREEGTLKNLTQYEGSIPFRGGVSKSMRTNIYRRKEAARCGKSLCYDKLPDVGEAYYLYSLPINIMRGLLQGLKTDTAVKEFNKESKILQTHKGTNYMFFHWAKCHEASTGNWRTHPYMEARPDLATSIESLGNFVERRLIFPDTPMDKQPGGLCNNERHVNGSQPPHFDVTGWQDIPANQLPHILHVPLCKEGMMLHVFPSQRNSSTHHLGNKEKMVVGAPIYVHIPFGDALLLRADVAHGGCYGSVGNFRFHMMLRKQNCPLETLRLLPLKNVSDTKSYKEALDRFKDMNSSQAFNDGNDRSTQFAVSSYMKAVKNIYPEEDNWHEGLFEAIHHLQKG